MNTKNNKTNEPHRFRLRLIDKINLENPHKNMALANLSIYFIYGKALNQHTTTKNLKFQLQLGMMNLICLMDLILLRTFKTTLNLSSENTKL